MLEQYTPYTFPASSPTDDIGGPSLVVSRNRFEWKKSEKNYTTEFMRVCVVNGSSV